MADLNKENFLEALKAKLPNATVKCISITKEERGARLEYIHRINQIKSHAPTLGNGALSARMEK
ncbi:MAG: hypothetical protein ACXWT0_00250 [Methylobacter sp.]